MITSMTGFGRYEEDTDSLKISAEIKAVNHRYLDLQIKMPKRFNVFEADIRSLLKTYIQRGKVDVFITFEDYTAGSLTLNYNEALAAEYMEKFRSMADTFGLENDIRVSTLARMPEVITMEQGTEDEAEIWKHLSFVIEKAAANFVDARAQEGEKLKTDLLSKLDYMDSLVDFIVERSPEIIREYRLRLEDKVKDLLADTSLDESRIAAEVTLYADKICVDEEMVRLRSHIDAMRKDLQKGGCIGRELDFLAQEMNREANTTLSKSSDLEVSDKAIALKTEIEKVREQVQNIE